MGVLWPQLSKVLKVVCWAGSAPFPPVSLQRQVVCLLLQPVFMRSSQGRAYTVSSLVGGQIKVVIATSDLWLFIHASNLLPSTPHPHCPTGRTLRNFQGKSLENGPSDTSLMMLENLINMVQPISLAQHFLLQII